MPDIEPVDTDTDNPQAGKNFVQSLCEDVKGLFVKQAPCAGFSHAVKCVYFFLTAWAVFTWLNSVATSVTTFYAHAKIMGWENFSHDFDSAVLLVTSAAFLISLGLATMKGLALFALARMLKYGANMFIELAGSMKLRKEDAGKQ